MGVPGFGKRTKNLLKRRDPAFFYDGDFYIDALNYFSEIDHVYARVPKPKSLDTTWDDVERVAAASLAKLTELTPPHSITFVWDASVSEEKFAKRMKRLESRLRRIATCNHNEFGKRSAPVVQALLHHRMGNCRMIYAGGEADDAIMKEIDESTTRYARRQFVFSNDTDFYRYEVKNAHLVEIVPLQPMPKFVAFSRTLNLRQALGTVPSEQIVHMPVKLPAPNVESDQPQRRYLIEYYNILRSYGRLFIQAPVVWFHMRDGLEKLDTAACGADLRRLHYRLLFESIRANRATADIQFDASEVTEWHQVGYKMHPLVVEVMSDADTKLCLETFVGVAFPQLFKGFYTQFVEQLPIERHDDIVDAVCACVKDLHEGYMRPFALRRSRRYETDFELLFGFARSLLVTFGGIDSVHDLFTQLGWIKYEFDEDRVLEYVNDFRACSESDTVTSSAQEQQRPTK